MYYTNITGESSSRLTELKKYAIGVPFNKQYIGNGSASYDGVDFNNSIENILIIYYIGGIKYYDDLINNITTFEFTPDGITDINFINKPIYKDPNKENIISNPKINDDVFIIRQEISAFNDNYRLEYIDNLSDLVTYAGGNYFNIVKNT